MKKWGKRIISGVIAASLLTAAAISGSEQGTGTVASVVQAGTETSFMGKLLEGGYSPPGLKKNRINFMTG